MSYQRIIINLTLLTHLIILCTAYIPRETHYIQLDEERNTLTYFEYILVDTRLSESWSDLPSKHDHVMKHGFKTSMKEKFDDLNTCKTKIQVKVLRFNVKDVILCLFKDHWENDIVEHLHVEIHGHTYDAKGLNEKVQPVTGYVLHHEASLVSGYIIDENFYGQVRLLDTFRNHFIVYYIEPLSMARMYDQKINKDELQGETTDPSLEATAILFEYIAHTETVPDRVPMRLKPKTPAPPDHVIEEPLLNIPHEFNAHVTTPDTILSTTNETILETTTIPPRVHSSTVPPKTTSPSWVYASTGLPQPTQPPGVYSSSMSTQTTTPPQIFPSTPMQTSQPLQLIIASTQSQSNPTALPSSTNRARPIHFTSGTNRPTVIHSSTEPVPPLHSSTMTTMSPVVHSSTVTASPTNEPTLVYISTVNPTLPPPLIIHSTTQPNNSHLHMTSVTTLHPKTVPTPRVSRATKSHYRSSTAKGHFQSSTKNPSRERNLHMTVGTPPFRLTTVNSRPPIIHFTTNPMMPQNSTSAPSLIMSTKVHVHSSTVKPRTGSAVVTLVTEPIPTTESVNPDELTVVHSSTVTPTPKPPTMLASTVATTVPFEQKTTRHMQTLIVSSQVPTIPTTSRGPPYHSSTVTSRKPVFHSTTIVNNLNLQLNISNGSVAHTASKGVNNTKDQETQIDPADFKDETKGNTSKINSTQNQETQSDPVQSLKDPDNETDVEYFYLGYDYSEEVDTVPGEGDNVMKDDSKGNLDSGSKKQSHQTNPNSRPKPRPKQVAIGFNDLLLNKHWFNYENEPSDTESNLQPQPPPPNKIDKRNHEKGFEMEVENMLQNSGLVSENGGSSESEQSSAPSENEKSSENKQPSAHSETSKPTHAPVTKSVENQTPTHIRTKNHAPPTPTHVPTQHHAPPTPTHVPTKHHAPTTPTHLPTQHHAPPTPTHVPTKHHAPPTPTHDPTKHHAPPTIPRSTQGPTTHISPIQRKGKKYYSTTPPKLLRRNNKPHWQPGYGTYGGNLPPFNPAFPQQNYNQGDLPPPMFPIQFAPQISYEMNPQYLSPPAFNMPYDPMFNLPPPNPNVVVFNPPVAPPPPPPRPVLQSPPPPPPVLQPPPPPRPVLQPPPPPPPVLQPHPPPPPVLQPPPPPRPVLQPPPPPRPVPQSPPPQPPTDGEPKLAISDIIRFYNAIKKFQPPQPPPYIYENPYFKEQQQPRYENSYHKEPERIKTGGIHTHHGGKLADSLEDSSDFHSYQSNSKSDASYFRERPVTNDEDIDGSKSHIVLLEQFRDFLNSQLPRTVVKPKKNPNEKRDAYSNLLNLLDGWNEQSDLQPIRLKKRNEDPGSYNFDITNLPNVLSMDDNMLNDTNTVVKIPKRSLKIKKKGKKKFVRVDNSYTNNMPTNYIYMDVKVSESLKKKHKKKKKHTKTTTTPTTTTVTTEPTTTVPPTLFVSTALPEKTRPPLVHFTLHPSKPPPTTQPPAPLHSTVFPTKAPPTTPSPAPLHSTVLPTKVTQHPKLIVSTIGPAKTHPVVIKSSTVAPKTTQQQKLFVSTKGPVPTRPSVVHSSTKKPVVTLPKLMFQSTPGPPRKIPSVVQSSTVKPIPPTAPPSPIKSSTIPPKTTIRPQVIHSSTVTRAPTTVKTLFHSSAETTVKSAVIHSSVIPAKVITTPTHLHSSTVQAVKPTEKNVFQSSSAPAKIVPDVIHSSTILPKVPVAPPSPIKSTTIPLQTTTLPHVIHSSTAVTTGSTLNPMLVSSAGTTVAPSLVIHSTLQSEKVTTKPPEPLHSTTVPAKVSENPQLFQSTITQVKVIPAVVHSSTVKSATIPPKDMFQSTPASEKSLPDILHSSTATPKIVTNPIGIKSTTILQQTTSRPEVIHSSTVASKEITSHPMIASTEGPPQQLPPVLHSTKPPDKPPTPPQTPPPPIHSTNIPMKITDTTKVFESTQNAAPTIPSVIHSSTIDTTLPPQKDVFQSTPAPGKPVPVAMHSSTELAPASLPPPSPIMSTTIPLVTTQLPPVVHSSTLHTAPPLPVVILMSTPETGTSPELIHSTLLPSKPPPTPPPIITTTTQPMLQSTPGPATDFPQVVHSSTVAAAHTPPAVVFESTQSAKALSPVIHSTSIPKPPTTLPPLIKFTVMNPPPTKLRSVLVSTKGTTIVPLWIKSTPSTVRKPFKVKTLAPPAPADNSVDDDIKPIKFTVPQPKLTVSPRSELKTSPGGRSGRGKPPATTPPPHVLSTGKSRRGRKRRELIENVIEQPLQVQVDSTLPNSEKELILPCYETPFECNRLKADLTRSRRQASESDVATETNVTPEPDVAPKPDVEHKPDVKHELNMTQINFIESTDVDDLDIIEEVKYLPGLKSGPVDVYDHMRDDALICSLCIWIQHDFAKSFGFEHGTMYAAGEIIDMVRYINWIFRPMDFSTDFKPENVGFGLKQIIVHDIPEIDGISSTDWVNSQNAVMDTVVKALVPKFSEHCCVILAYVYQDMRPYGSLSIRRGMCVRDKNVAIISGQLHGHKVAKYDVYRSTVHALGHLLGALNDDPADPDCKNEDEEPSAYTNPFIMQAAHHVNFGIRPNSMRMSICSRLKIGVFLGSSFTSCLENLAGPYCGNGIMEEGEECDCGAPWQCVYTHQCCGMRDSFSPCKIIDNKPGQTCKGPPIMDPQ